MQSRSNTVPLESYLNNGIKNLMSHAYKSALSNPKEALFIFRMQKVFGKAEKKRSDYKKKKIFIFRHSSYQA